MRFFLLAASNPRANARNVVQDFINLIEPVIALKNHDGRRLTRKRMAQDFEHLLRHRVGMTIGEQWPIETILAYGDSARHVQFLDNPGRQGVEKFVSVEAVIIGIQVKVFDIKEESGTGLAADQAEKLDVRQLRVRTSRRDR